MCAILAATYALAGRNEAHHGTMHVTGESQSLSLLPNDHFEAFLDDTEVIALPVALRKEIQVMPLIFVSKDAGCSIVPIN